jgi:hypothetical protein
MRPGHRERSIARCTEGIALDPSPTAATRFIEARRTSPTAKTRGTLVSKGSGRLPSVGQLQTDQMTVELQA